MRFIAESGPTVSVQASYSNLVELALSRANEKPDRTAYVFLQDGENESGSFSFADLDRRARAIAARLQSLGLIRERALLLYPPGLEYIEAFFGCLFAGVVAVPAYPPARHHLSRLQSILLDARPAVVMTTAELQARLIQGFSEIKQNVGCVPRTEFSTNAHGAQGTPDWLATDTLSTDGAEAWFTPALTPESLAFLQYTSGSTGNPKGVMVSHRNLLANQRAIQESFGHDEQTVVVGWLPLYHDMGLIGNILQPLYLGARAILMSPLSFMDQPVRWLQAISRYRATTSGGPNFAYELCLRKVTAEQKRKLDLSAWKVAFNGAEPVRASTIERFSAAFAECGFRREAFFPCYGLAEATLFVTGPVAGSPLKFRPGITPADADTASITAISVEQSKPFVGCGHAWADHEVKIVDPAARKLCAEGQLGEIWVAGPSIARGYWNQPEESACVFQAQLADKNGQTFLRTGDLGFLHHGELYVTGRIKDLMIVRGRNYYPHDLEQALDEQVESLRAGCNTAFSVILENEEQLVIVAEVRRVSLTSEEAQPIFDAMRQALADASDAPVHTMVLVPPGTVPKTSSGKIRRQACKEAYLGNLLKILARSDEPETASSVSSIASSTDFTNALLRDAFSALPKEQRTPFIERLLTAKIAQLLKVAGTSIVTTQAICSLGIRSLQAVELKHEVENLLQIEAPVTLFLSDYTLAQIAETLAREKPLLNLPDKKQETKQKIGLSYAQKAIWTVHQMELNNIAYNLHLALRIQGKLDSLLLQQSIRWIIERHTQLCTVYRAEDENIYQSIVATDALPDRFSVIDTTNWDEHRLQEELNRQAKQSFDLSDGPLLRVCLFTHADGVNTLFFCAHHIAVDLWSLLVVLHELGLAYEILAKGQIPDLPAPDSHYQDFIAWQNNYINSRSGKSAREYWNNRLAGELPILSLPTDYTRPPTPSYHGASHAFRIDPELTGKLKALGQSHGTTLFAVLLTAYNVLLHRYTHQKDLIVGVPASGRSQSRFAPVVGNFVNPLPLRSHPAGDKPFSAYLAEVNETLLSALEYQDFPFPLIVESLQPERVADHWPIYQTLFVLQQAQAGIDTDLAQLALGEDGEFSAWGTLWIRPLAIQQRVENFDLKLMATECQNGLQFSFQYRSDLFGEDTIASWAVHFQRLIAGIVTDANIKLSELPLLSADEWHRLTVAWNATETEYSGASCIHQLFEAQVEKIPNEIALVYQNRQLTYRELNARSNRLAHALIAAKVGPDTPVGICAHRSLEMVIGLLGILKAGCAYLPLDPDYPHERLSAMLSDADAPLILVQPEFAHTFSDFTGTIYTLDTELSYFTGFSEQNPDVRIDDETLAYVLFTSGSTGRPKGVGVPHKGVRNRLLWMQGYFGLDVGDAVLQKTPYTFDVSVWEFFWPLMSGARLIMAGPGDHKEPERLVDLIDRHRVTTLHFVPSMLSAFLNAADFDRCVSWRRVICSGEALSSDLQKRFYEHANTELFNLYGPTEASIDVTVWDCGRDQPETPVPIGRPIANTRIYLLDRHLNPVPAGVAGELYIGGVQLARGYLNRPDLTAERFVPNPFAETGDRLYRTGDLARYRRDGAIDYLGRIDHQVKIRGFRIELGEIESVLLQNPTVSEAVVVIREDGPGDKYLAVYWVRNPESAPEIEVLQNFLKERLPDYMIPAVLMELDRLPVTANGKLDRKALPVPDFGLQFADQYVAPRNEVEKDLARIWSDVLRIERIGIHDNFFALGGDSILSIQVSSRTHQVGWTVTPRQLFKYQTIAELATVVAKNSQESSDTQLEKDSKDYVPYSLTKLSQLELESLLVNHVNIEDAYPLSSMQEGILFHTLSSPGSGVYVMQDRYEIFGKIDLEAFRLAWQSVMDNNPILRTSFDWDLGTRPLQIVNRDAILPFEYLDWSNDNEAGQHDRLEALLLSEQVKGFDLAGGPSFRIRIINCGKQRYFCIRSYHHILIDEWSTSPMFLEFKEYYAALSLGKPLHLKQIRPFREYIAWLECQNKAKAESYWRGNLQGFTEPMALSEKQGYRPTHIESSVEDITVRLSEADTEALNFLTQQYRITPNTFVQGALALLLCRYEGRPEVVFGVTVSGRPSTLAGAETMLGLFINALPLRIAIRVERPLLSWLRDLLAQNLEMRQYEYSSLVDIQSWSSIPRSQGELFQHLLTFENAPVDSSLITENDIINMKFLWNRIHTNYPITFVAIPGKQMSLRITYQTARFDSQDMERMIGHFKTLLEEMIHYPEKRVGEIAILAHQEYQQILINWNQTNHPHPEPCDMVALFEAQTALTPDEIAVAFQGQQLTYSQLNNRVNRVAHALVSEGADPETLIAIFSERGIDYLVMMLGAFKAGIAYLPLDPGHPDGRNAQVLKESGAGWILTCASYFERASVLADRTGEIEAKQTSAQASPSLNVQLRSRPEVFTLEELESCEHGTENPPKRHSPDNLAFVIFTSGSTGMPKGAMVEYKGMFNNLITKVPTLGLTEKDVIAQTAGQCFDISVWQHLTALVCGARVEIFPDDIVREPNRLLTELAERGVTVLEAVPSMIQMLLEIVDEAIELPKLRWLIACGEAFPPELCRRWMDRFPHVKVLNAYGPAECSDDVSYYEVPARPNGTETILPIGRPVHNTRLYLLDRWLEPVPIGVPGEICVAGIQVGRGYLDRPDLTAEKFIPDPFDKAGARLYRTGDLGRYREDGAIEFLGRIDHQVKIRGVRIEPGEIEAQLLSFPNVEQALVTVREDGASGKRLVAYVVCDEVEISSDAELIGRIGSLPIVTLPTSMDGGNADDFREQSRPPNTVDLKPVPFALSLSKGERNGRLKPLMVRQAHHERLKSTALSWPPSLAVGRLRDHLSARLPNAMMLSAFVRLDAMPLSANGKIDRKALPEPDLAGQSDRAYVAPRNPAEEALVDIWKEVLGIERVGVADNFFELGGHSLLAMQVLSRIRRAFGVEVPLRRLFEAATIEALALLVEEFLIEHLNSLSEEEAEALLNDNGLDE